MSNNTNTNADVKSKDVKNTNEDEKQKEKPKEKGGRVHLDINDPKIQDKLSELNWYLGIANPVFKSVKKNINVLKNGKTVSKDVVKQEFDHYDFNAVKGVKFQEWVKNTFGKEYEVDEKTKEIYKIEK